MDFIKIKSHAKINLALNIIGKNSSLHKIESIIAFISLHDDILIKKINSKKHKISFYGKFSKNIGKNNTVHKLLQILEKKKLLKNKKFQIKINKRIPNKAGLGGGSMNAANILRYFIKKKLVQTSEKKILEICKLVGSDVILGIKSTSSILTSKGKIKYFRDYKKFYALIVKPNFGCSTKNIYSKVSNFEKSRFNRPHRGMLNLKYLVNSKITRRYIIKIPEVKIDKIIFKNLFKPVLQQLVLI